MSSEELGLVKTIYTWWTHSESYLIMRARGELLMSRFWSEDKSRRLIAKLTQVILMENHFNTKTQGFQVNLGMI